MNSIVQNLNYLGFAPTGICVCLSFFEFAADFEFFALSPPVLGEALALADLPQQTRGKLCCHTLVSHHRLL